MIEAETQIDYERMIADMGAQLARIELGIVGLSRDMAALSAQRPTAATGSRSQPSGAHGGVGSQPAPRAPAQQRPPSDGGRSAYCRCEHECWRQYARAVDAGGPPCACTDCWLDGDYGMRLCGCSDPSDANQQFELARQGNRFRWMPSQGGGYGAPDPVGSGGGDGDLEFE